MKPLGVLLQNTQMQNNHIYITHSVRQDFQNTEQDLPVRDHWAGWHLMCF